MANEAVINMMFGGSCGELNPVVSQIQENADAYCKVTHKGDLAEIIETKPGNRHGSKDVYECVDGMYEAWVRFRCL